MYIFGYLPEYIYNWCPQEAIQAETLPINTKLPSSGAKLTDMIRDKKEKAA